MTAKKRNRVIPYSRQKITDEDIDAVVSVLRSDYLTQGPTVELFEQAISEYVGSRFALTVSSCTAGLHCLYSALYKPMVSNYLLTTPLTFASTVNAAKLVGYKPVLIDINLKTFGLCCEALENALEHLRRVDAGSNIVVANVHYSGCAVNSCRISNIAGKYEAIVVEDAAHSFGGSYDDGSKVGSPGTSAASVFSFHPVKSMTTGEGGVVVTDSEPLFNRMKRLRSHGISKSDEELEDPDLQIDSNGAGWWYYEVLELGLNYRLTDIQAALGLSQLKKIDSFMNERKLIAGRYDKIFELKGLDHLKYPAAIAKHLSANHLYPILVDYPVLGLTRPDFIVELNKRNIRTQVHYIPIYKHPFYRNLSSQISSFPNTEFFYSRCLSIPIYPGLSITEQDYVIDQISQLCVI